MAISDFVATVLIIDDSALFRESFSDMLKSRFHKLMIIEAENEQEACAAVQMTPPDLIFTDISLTATDSNTTLPQRNGMDITRALKKNYPSIPIAVLTCHDLPEYRDAAFEYGADYFIVKDIASVQLFALVESVLGYKYFDIVHRLSQQV